MRVLRVVLAAVMMVSVCLPVEYARAQAVRVPAPQLLSLSQPLEPVQLKGIKFDPEHPLRMEFVVSEGNESDKVPGTKYLNTEFQHEAQKLIRYFLAALTTPEQDLWVNLSPHEPDRIIAPGMGETSMGRDMLAQDYLLKQLTASMLHPDNEYGQQFWQRVYAEAFERYGTTDIPVDTLHKVWIVPDKARVYEKEHAAYVTRARLKVMVEEDYFVASSQQSVFSQISESRQLEADHLSTEVLRSIIIPALEREVNEGAHFAPLRQIYNALILATWMKQKLAHARDRSVLNTSYIDQNKTVGVDHGQPGINEETYQQYLKSVEEGVFNVIQDVSHQQSVFSKEISENRELKSDRRYFSGGVDAAMMSVMLQFDDASAVPAQLDHAQVITVDLNVLPPPQQDFALDSGEKDNPQYAQKFKRFIHDHGHVYWTNYINNKTLHFEHNPDLISENESGALIIDPVLIQTWDQYDQQHFQYVLRLSAWRRFIMKQLHVLDDPYAFKVEIATALYFLYSQIDQFNRFDDDQQSQAYWDWVKTVFPQGTVYVDDRVQNFINQRRGEANQRDKYKFDEENILEFAKIMQHVLGGRYQDVVIDDMLARDVNLLLSFGHEMEKSDGYDLLPANGSWLRTSQMIGDIVLAVPGRSVWMDFMYHYSNHDRVNDLETYRHIRSKYLNNVSQWDEIKQQQIRRILNHFRDAETGSATRTGKTVTWDGRLIKTHQMTLDTLTQIRDAGFQGPINVIDVGASSGTTTIELYDFLISQNIDVDLHVIGTDLMVAYDRVETKDGIGYFDPQTHELIQCQFKPTTTMINEEERLHFGLSVFERGESYGGNVNGLIAKLKKVYDQGRYAGPEVTSLSGIDVDIEYRRGELDNRLTMIQEDLFRPAYQEGTLAVVRMFDIFRLPGSRFSAQEFERLLYSWGQKLVEGGVLLIGENHQNQFSMGVFKREGNRLVLLSGHEGGHQFLENYQTLLPSRIGIHGFLDLAMEVDKTDHALEKFLEQHRGQSYFHEAFFAKMFGVFSSQNQLQSMVTVVEEVKNNEKNFKLILQEDFIGVDGLVAMMKDDESFLSINARLMPQAYALHQQFQQQFGEEKMRQAVVMMPEYWFKGLLQLVEILDQTGLSLNQLPSNVSKYLNDTAPDFKIGVALSIMADVYTFKKLQRVLGLSDDHLFLGLYDNKRDYFNDFILQQFPSAEFNIGYFIKGNLFVGHERLNKDLRVYFDDLMFGVEPNGLSMIYGPLKYVVPQRWSDEDIARMRTQMGLPENRQVIVLANESQKMLSLLGPVLAQYDANNRPLLIAASVKKNNEVLSEKWTQEMHILERNDEHVDTELGFDGLAEGRPMNEADIVLLNSYGELAEVFNVADVVYSDRDRNLMEPLAMQHAKVIVFGESALNDIINDIVDRFDAVDSLNLDDLAGQLQEALASSREDQQVQQQAIEFFQDTVLPPAQELTRLMVTAKVVDRVQAEKVDDSGMQTAEARLKRLLPISSMVSDRFNESVALHAHFEDVFGEDALNEAVEMMPEFWINGLKVFSDILHQAGLGLDDIPDSIPAYLAQQGSNQQPLGVYLNTMADVYTWRAIQQRLGLQDQDFELAIFKDSKLNEELVRRYWQSKIRQGFLIDDKPQGFAETETLGQFNFYDMIFLFQGRDFFINYGPLKFPPGEPISEQQYQDLRFKMGLSPGRQVIVLGVDDENILSRYLGPWFAQLNPHDRPLLVVASVSKDSDVLTQSWAKDLVILERSNQDVDSENGFDGLASGRPFNDADVVLLNSYGELAHVLNAADVVYMNKDRNLMEAISRQRAHIIAFGDVVIKNVIINNVAQRFGAVQSFDPENGIDQLRAALANPHQDRAKQERAVMFFRDQVYPPGLELIRLMMSAVIIHHIQQANIPVTLEDDVNTRFFRDNQTLSTNYVQMALLQSHFEEKYGESVLQEVMSIMPKFWAEGLAKLAEVLNEGNMSIDEMPEDLSSIMLQHEYLNPLVFHLSHRNHIYMLQALQESLGLNDHHLQFARFQTAQVSTDLIKKYWPDVPVTEGVINDEDGGIDAYRDFDGRVQFRFTEDYFDIENKDLMMLPLGPLQYPIKDAMKKADMVALRQAMGLPDRRQVIVVGLGGDQIIDSLGSWYAKIPRINRPLLIITSMARDRVVRQSWADGLTILERRAEDVNDAIGFDGMASGQPFNDADVVLLNSVDEWSTVVNAADIVYMDHDHNLMEIMNRLRATLVVFGDKNKGGRIINKVAQRFGAVRPINMNDGFNQLITLLLSPQVDMAKHQKAVGFFREKVHPPALELTRLIITASMVGRVQRDTQMRVARDDRLKEHDGAFSKALAPFDSDRFVKYITDFYKQAHDEDKRLLSVQLGDMDEWGVPPQDFFPTYADGTPRPITLSEMMMMFRKVQHLIEDSDIMTSFMSNNRITDFINYVLFDRPLVQQRMDDWYPNHRVIGLARDGLLYFMEQYMSQHGEGVVHQDVVYYPGYFPVNLTEAVDDDFNEAFQQAHAAVSARASEILIDALEDNGGWKDKKSYNDVSFREAMTKLNQWLDERDDVRAILEVIFNKQIDTLHLDPDTPVVLYDTWASGKSALIAATMIQRRVSMNQPIRFVVGVSKIIMTDRTELFRGRAFDGVLNEGDSWEEFSFRAEALPSVEPRWLWRFIGVDVQTQLPAFALRDNDQADARSLVEWFFYMVILYNRSLIGRHDELPLRHEFPTQKLALSALLKPEVAAYFLPSEEDLGMTMTPEAWTVLRQLIGLSVVQIVHAQEHGALSEMRGDLDALAEIEKFKYALDWIDELGLSEEKGDWVYQVGFDNTLTSFMAFVSSVRFSTIIDKGRFPFEIKQLKRPFGDIWGDFHKQGRFHEDFEARYVEAPDLTDKLSLLIFHEAMQDVSGVEKLKALRDVKPGGHLVFVAPDDGRIQKTIIDDWIRVAARVGVVLKASSSEALDTLYAGRAVMLQVVSKDRDVSMVTDDVGGIDLQGVASRLNVDDDSFVAFDAVMDEAMLAQLENAVGLEPMVVGVRPLVNLHRFLGM